MDVFNYFKSGKSTLQTQNNFFTPFQTIARKYKYLTCYKLWLSYHATNDMLVIKSVCISILYFI